MRSALVWVIVRNPVQRGQCFQRKADRVPMIACKIASNRGSDSLSVRLDSPPSLIFRGRSVIWVAELVRFLWQTKIATRRHGTPRSTFGRCSRTGQGACPNCSAALKRVARPSRTLAGRSLARRICARWSAVPKL